MEFDMVPLQGLAAIKIAIKICIDPDLKREILCAPGSDYDINKNDDEYYCRKQWQEIVEEKATVIMRSQGLPELLQRKVMGIVLPIGMRMLNWAAYHEGTLGFSREYSINILNSSFFTQHGIIDNRKAAEELIKDKSLNSRQKYNLACLYCLTDHISDFYRKTTRKDNEEFYSIYRWIREPNLVIFWSYFMRDKVDELKGDKDPDLYRLQKAIECGSKEAVKYSFQKNLTKKDIVDAAAQAVRKKIAMKYDDVWAVFSNERLKHTSYVCYWVPSDSYIDMLCFLLSKMTQDVLVEFLKKDIGFEHRSKDFEDGMHTRVLEYFLNWPYQDYFMKIAEIVWDILPERNFAILLLKICDKIEPRGMKHFCVPYSTFVQHSFLHTSHQYGDEKSYDYRELLKEFWFQSPERFKRYVFSTHNINFNTYKGFEINFGVGLLIYLLTLKHFTDEDRKIIRLILANATEKEKENMFSEDWESVCLELMEAEKWEIVDRIVFNCFSSKEKRKEFKKELSFTGEALCMCIDFAKNEKWNAAEAFIKWISLPEEEIDTLKKGMIYSDRGMYECVNLISYNNFKALDKFIRWYFLSDLDVNAFKKQLIFSSIGVHKCANLVSVTLLDLASEFISLCLSSEKEINELKKILAYETGSSVFSKLISGFSKECIVHGQGHLANNLAIKFEGGRWDEVETFLTWYFSSEEEISDFKINVLLKEAGVRIHLNLIQCNQWGEAETFFAWLGLSDEQVKELKKETLFHYDAAREMFKELMFSEEGDERFVHYGSKQDAIQLLLKWCLTDKETVLEFQDEYKRWYWGEVKEETNAVTEKFDLAIEQVLSDLDK